MDSGLPATMALGFWLGILTAISPCPMATNIAAMSFIARHISSSRRSLIAGLLYTAGRIVTYVAIGVIVVKGLTSTPGLAQFVQTYTNKLLGPVLVLVGMFLMELITFEFSFSMANEGLQEKAKGGGLVWPFFLGAIFALSFCPPAAALFFASLVPLAVKSNTPILLPALYGIGTGLPGVIFAVAIAKGAQTVGSTFERIKSLEWWARRVTGLIFICAGIYMSLVYVYQVL